MSKFLLGDEHQHIKPHTPSQFEVNVPEMQPCKSHAPFFTQENFATPEAQALLWA